jgi:hypothetical protein
LTLGSSFNGAAGTQFGYLSFTNTSAASCTLYGFATVTPLDSAGNALIFPAPPPGFMVGVSVVQYMGPPRVVTLPPGGEAFFGFAYGHVNILSIPCVKFAALRIVPPNGSSAGLILNQGDTVCSNFAQTPIYAGPPPPP